MDKVLLVSVIALAVALLSMLVNLALVWKISDLKNKLEWIELTVNDRTSQLHKDDVEISNQLNKLECNTKDAFGKVTNHLTRHDDEINRVVKKYEEMETRVAKHTGQLEDLGNFAGITTGELRVLEQKIYNSCKPKELPEPYPTELEESKNRVGIKTHDIELSSLSNRIAILETKRHSILNEQNDIVTRVDKLEHRLAKLLDGFDTFKGDTNRVLDHHMVEVDRRIRNRMIPVEEVDIRKHKPDRKRKDNYYRRPNQVSVEKREDFSGDVYK
jgi:hypothetical protein